MTVPNIRLADTLYIIRREVKGGQLASSSKLARSLAFPALSLCICRLLSGHRPVKANRFGWAAVATLYESAICRDHGSWFMGETLLIIKDFTLTRLYWDLYPTSHKIFTSAPSCPLSVCVFYGSSSSIEFVPMVVISRRRRKKNDDRWETTLLDNLFVRRLRCSTYIKNVAFSYFRILICSSRHLLSLKQKTSMHMSRSTFTRGRLIHLFGLCV